MKIKMRENLGLILASAAFLRLSLILVVHNFHDPETWEFGAIARNILAGRGYWFKTLDNLPVPSAFMPPGYVYFLASMLKIFGDRTFAYVLIQLLQAASSVVLVYLVYRKAELLFGERVALLAAWITALYPPFIYMCTEMHPISFYTVLSLAVVFYLYRFIEKGGRRNDLVLSGILLGLLLMFRAEALALILIFPIILLLRSAKGWKLKNAAVFLVLPLVCLAPWTIRNYRIFHHWVPITTAGGLSLWYGHNPDATGSQRYAWPDGSVVQPPISLVKSILKIPPSTQYEIALDHLYRQQAQQFLRQHPSRELELLGNKFLYFWVADFNHPKARVFLYWAPSFLLVLLWGCGLVWNRRNALREHLVFTATIFFSMALCLVLFVLPRYRMVVEPMMIPYGSQVLFFAYGACQNRTLSAVVGETASTKDERGLPGVSSEDLP